MDGGGKMIEVAAAHALRQLSHIGWNLSGDPERSQLLSKNLSAALGIRKIDRHLPSETGSNRIIEEVRAIRCGNHPNVGPAGYVIRPTAATRGENDLSHASHGGPRSASPRDPPVTPILGLL